MFLEIFYDLLNENFLNRKQFAEKSGIPYPTVIGWTNLNRMPDYYALIKIADFFGCSVDYLMGRQNDYKISGAKAAELEGEHAFLNKYMSLTEDDKKIIKELVGRLSEK